MWYLIFLSRSSFGITGSMTSAMIASRSFLRGDVLGVLRRDDDGLDGDRSTSSYTTVTCALPSGRSHAIPVSWRRNAASALGEPVREQDRHRHQLVRLVASRSRTSCPDRRRRRCRRPCAMSGDCRSIVLMTAHVLESKPNAGVGVADPLDRRAHDLGNVDVRRRRDLAGDAGEAGRDERLAGDARLRDRRSRIASSTASEIASATLSG